VGIFVRSQNTQTIDHDGEGTEMLSLLQRESLHTKDGVPEAENESARIGG